MLEFLANIIYVVIIAVSVLVVTYCIIGKIGDEYRKTSEYASKSIDNMLSKLPDTIITCIDVVKKKEAEKKATSASTPEGVKLSCKEDTWGII